MPSAIAVQDVKKRFRRYRERPTSIKERIVRIRVHAEELWALKGVSVEVQEGETLGLLGPNGSGKTTLLKIIAGILRPTEGSVTARGRIASLLALGAGFHNELTGRENVYLNASLMGMTRAQTNRRFDDIVRFAELEDFIDNQVKFYSSGMYVRLGFAVAAHVDPAILLVDEVLAVGDPAFAAKCLAKVAEFQAQGRTILFVTHGLDQVGQVCDRAVVLNQGRMLFDGEPADADSKLRAFLGTSEDPAAGLGSDGLLEIVDAHVVNPATGAEQLDFDVGDKLAIDVAVRGRGEAPTADVRMVV